MLLAHLGPHRERRLGKRRGWHYPLSMGEWTEGEISRRKEKKMLAHVFSSCCENIPANQDIVFTNAADEWMLLPRSDVWQPHQLCQTYSKAIFNRLALLSLYYEGDNFLIVNIRCMCRAAASFRFFLSAAFHLALVLCTSRSLARLSGTLDRMLPSLTLLVTTVVILLWQINGW